MAEDEPKQIGSGFFISEGDRTCAMCKWADQKHTLLVVMTVSYMNLMRAVSSSLGLVLAVNIGNCAFNE